MMSNPSVVGKINKLLEDFQVVDRGIPILTDSKGDVSTLLYAANPVYMDVSQDKAAMSQKMTYTPLLFAIGGVYLMGRSGINCFNGLVAGENMVFNSFGLLLTSVMVIGFTLYLIACLRAFFLPPDNVVRFDRKRQLVYVWAQKRELFGNIRSFRDLLELPFDKRELIVLPWKNLYPTVCRRFTGALRTQAYIAGFAEYLPNAPVFNFRTMKYTNRIPHWAKVGIVHHSAGSQGDDKTLYEAAIPLEPIRLFMEEGYSDWMRPKYWRKPYWPDWRSTFLFFDSVDRLQDPNLGPNTLRWKIVAWVFLSFAYIVLYFPLMFYPWLASQFSPRFRFPDSVEKQHHADLQELGIDQYGDPVSSPPSTTAKPSVPLGLWLLDKLLAGTAFTLAVAALLIAVLTYNSFEVSEYLGIAIFDSFEQLLFDMFALPMICFGIAILIAYLSRSMIEKVNPRDAAWFPAKPHPDSPANQMTDDVRQKTEDRYSL